MSRHRKNLTSLSAIFLIVPLAFWLVVWTNYRGGSGWLLRIWNYIPFEVFKILIVLLPLPALVLGMIALWRNRQEGGIKLIGSLGTVLLSIFFTILCSLAVLDPG
jgi:hypothetical protein